MNIFVKSKRLGISIGSYCLFFLIICLSKVSLIHTQTVAELIKQGDAFHSQFDTYNAFKCYKTAAELDSTNFEVLWKMAAELIDMGNELPKSDDQVRKYQEALLISQKAIQLNPNHCKGHLMLALALEKNSSGQSGSERIKGLNQSRLAAKKAIEINPDEDMGYNLLGRWNREMANTGWLARTFTKLFVVSTPPASYEKAIEQFQRAIAINNQAIIHYFELGKTYILTEKWTDAAESFQKVLDLPASQKSDSKCQRAGRHYLQLLQQGNHSELTDSIVE